MRGREEAGTGEGDGRKSCEGAGDGNGVVNDSTAGGEGEGKETGGKAPIVCGWSMYLDSNSTLV